MSDIEVNFVNSLTNENAEASLPRDARRDEIITTLLSEGFIGGGESNASTVRLSIQGYGDIPERGTLGDVVPKDVTRVTISIAPIQKGGI